jgi:hypothetical protein
MLVPGVPEEPAALGKPGSLEAVVGEKAYESSGNRGGAGKRRNCPAN